MAELLRRGTPLEWGFLLGLAVPMFIYHIVLRSIRVVQRGHMVEVLRWIDVYKSDLFFHAAFTLLGIALLVALRGRFFRPAALVGLQLVAVVVTVVELIAFRFFVATGSTVDFQLIWFSVSQMSETFGVVSSEVPPEMWWMLAISIVLALALPWGVALFWSKFVSPRLARREASPIGRRGILAVSAASVVAAGLAFTPPVAEESRAFARNAFLNVTWSAMWSVSDMFGGEAHALTSTVDARLEPRSNQTERRNVVVILLESTRARSVSVYNPELETTPHLKKLAESSLVAERAYAVVPHTSKALVATLCGIEPRLHMPITEAIKDGIPGKCLAKILGEQGYRTAFFQSATQRFEKRPSLVENMGYDDFYPLEKLNKRGFKKVNYFGREDDVMLEPSGKWLDEAGDEPFLLTYLTLTPHHDYLAPRTYGRHDFAEDDELNRYLNTLHYVDAFVNNVIEMFKEKGLYEDTIFVIVGDHGEGFGEHGRRQHDNVIWEEGLHVPLIVHDPKRFQEGVRVPHVVNHLDIIPTVADLLDFEIANASYPGRSIARLDVDRVMRAHCWFERRCMASIYRNEKFIHHFEQRPDEFFDLESDPDEKNDLADQTEDLERRRSDLLTWRARVNALYRQHTRGRIEEFVTDSPPVVQHPIDDAQFGDFVKLIGVDYPEDPRRPGTNASVHFVFEVIEKLPPGWKMFVHGESPGTKMKNLDHPPVDGLYPYEDWRPGDYISDNLRFRIPKNARDEYVLWLGFYHPDDGRAPVTGAIETDGANRAKAIVLDLADPKPRKLKKSKKPTK